ncbi:hypothetical protein PRIC1_005389 [Phytophthora ramorum]
MYAKTRHLSWIFETYTDGPLVPSGSYTTGACYYYLLEMDDAGAIIDGEWVYDSDDDHLDFRCFPKAKPAADTATSISRATLTCPYWPARPVPMEDLTTNFNSIIREFQYRNHDLLDYKNNRFDRDYVEFNVRISDLEGLLQKFINDSFENITSI